jgi:serine palmitoyltransferase
MGPEAAAVIPSLATSLAPRLRDGSEGKERLRRLAFNARFLSTGLRRLGFLCEGHTDSPVIPMLIFHPGKLATFSRLMLQRHNIVVVVVAYPATPLVSGRARFCVSAAHTVADMCRLLRAIDDVGRTVGVMYGKRTVAGVDELESKAVELVHGKRQ